MKQIITIIILVCIFFTGCTKSESYSATEILMDTVCTITTDSELRAINAFAIINEVAQDTDYYSDTSYVSSINNAKAEEVVPISEAVYEIVKTSKDIFKATDGAFDITIAPLKDVWRFNEGNHQPPTSAQISEALNIVTSNFIFIGETETVFKKSYDRVKIDLGAAAKGYAVDMAVKSLKNSGASFGLINFGGTIYAFGKNPDRQDGKWEIGIKDPKGDGYITTVTIEEGAVVTSGDYERYFEWDNKKYHHILDPKDGYPTDSGLSSATIVGKSALVADCLSTACMVVGREKANILAEQYGVEFIGF